MGFLTFFKYAIPVFFGFGSWLGKDPLFSQRNKRDCGIFWIAELGAADRQYLTDEAIRISQDENKSPQQKSAEFLTLRLRALACAARNKSGWFLYNPGNVQDLIALNQLPDSAQVSAMTAIAELSGMPWMDIRITDDQEPPENPS